MTGSDRPVKAGEHAQLAAAGQLPIAGPLLVTCRQDMAAIGGERDAVDLLGMPSELPYLAELTARDHFVNLDVARRAAYEQVLAVGRVGAARDLSEYFQ